MFVRTLKDGIGGKPSAFVVWWRNVRIPRPWLDDLAVAPWFGAEDVEHLASVDLNFQASPIPRPRPSSFCDDNGPGSYLHRPVCCRCLQALLPYYYRHRSNSTAPVPQYQAGTRWTRRPTATDLKMSRPLSSHGMARPSCMLEPRLQTSECSEQRNHST